MLPNAPDHEKRYRSLHPAPKRTPHFWRTTALSEPAFEVVNLGKGETPRLDRPIELIALGPDAEPRIRRRPMQPGDVERTYADITRARELFGSVPETSVEEGIPRFLDWFRSSALEDVPDPVS